MRHPWPQLAVMALNILTVVPTSDGPEKQFRDAGMMITNRRNRFRSDTVEATISFKIWTRERVFGYTDADTKALTMNTGNNVTNAANVSEQFARSTNRPT